METFLERHGMTNLWSGCLQKIVLCRAKESFHERPPTFSERKKIEYEEFRLTCGYYEGKKEGSN